MRRVRQHWQSIVIVVLVLATGYQGVCILQLARMNKLQNQMLAGTAALAVNAMKVSWAATGQDLPVSMQIALADLEKSLDGMGE